MGTITSTWTELLQQFFPIFTAPGAEIFSQLMVGWVLCTVRRTVTGILPFADPLAKTRPRCLSPLLARCPLEHGKAVATAGQNTDSDILSQRTPYAGSGRYTVSSQRQKSRGRGLVARRRPFDPEKHRLCLGSESGGVDLANPAALGRRASGLAYQHAVAPKKWPDLDRIGCADDKRGLSVVAAKAVSGGRGRVLRHSGGKSDARRYAHLPNQTKCKSVRPAAQEKKETARASSYQRKEARQTGKDGSSHSRLADGHISPARQNRQPAGLYSCGSLVRGDPQAHPAGYQSGPKWQRKGRLSFQHRCDDGPCRGIGLLRRPLANRRHIQKHQATSRWAGAANLERPRAGACGRTGSLAVFDGLAVVSEGKVQTKAFRSSAVVPSEGGSEFRRCVELPSPRALA